MPGDPLFACTWTGNAVGINRKIAVRRGRPCNSPEYKNFLDDLLWAFHRERVCALPDTIAVPVWVKRVEYVNPARDHDSLTKPICDALELAGVVANDNLITRSPRELIAKKRGTLDVITVEVYAADTQAVMTAEEG